MSLRKTFVVFLCAGFECESLWGPSGFDLPSSIAHDFCKMSEEQLVMEIYRDTVAFDTAADETERYINSLGSLPADLKTAAPLKLAEPRRIPPVSEADMRVYQR